MQLSSAQRFNGRSKLMEINDFTVYSLGLKFLLSNFPRFSAQYNSGLHG
ncbi:hypothetical protein ACFOET_00885 [Parapedobacter deserti]|uniref:Uncharacterized protein n=1 Tax=Parapedobacter deserti TaxID=1912957 RepID=A0ABV7JDK6_9SPHI